MRNRYVLLADLVAIAAAVLGAFVLRFDWLFFDDHIEFRPYLLAALIIKPVVFYLFGMYSRYWRYTSISDLRVVALAIFGSSAAMAIFGGVAATLGVMQGLSRAVVIIDSLLTLVAVCGIRLSIRVIGESRMQLRDVRHPLEPGAGAGKRILVVGAGEAGVMVVREMQRNPHLEMQPVGFLDDDRTKYGKRIYAVPVLGNLQSLGRIVRIARIDEVIIAMPRAAGASVRTVVEMCRALDIRSRTIPGVFELLDGKVSVDRLRSVEITDLLKRPQVEGRSGFDYLRGSTVLVTGAGGSIGFELCRQVAYARPARLVMLGHGENSLFEAHAQIHEQFADVTLQVVVADIRDRARIARVFAQYEPDVVFHAAAHKHVHLMEEHFEEAVSNNVVGTQNVVDAALATKTQRLVAISTDKAVSPTGIMGASKRMAGIIVREAARRSARKFLVVRFGNVLGSRGSVVPFFKRQIERGGPVTITHPEMKRFFMTIPEAVHLVLEAGGIGEGGELFVLNMGKPVRIKDLAEDLIRLSGFTTDQIPIVVSGVRPGEKLEEALWEREAMVEPTAHLDILKVRESERANDGDVRLAVEAMEIAANVGDRVGVEALLCDWIPTFTPSSVARQVAHSLPSSAHK
jgi:FlaA1/EpsC-like NDP-sugar epimerase